MESPPPPRGIVVDIDGLRNEEMHSVRVRVLVDARLLREDMKQQERIVFPKGVQLGARVERDAMVVKLPLVRGREAAYCPLILEGWKAVTVVEVGDFSAP
ncbi:MAG: hypothetical protein LBV45_11390 [Xanthomonadaceae bacterium]|jgi:hypothetical protein|nr:hypothetical protein [Xanthomonadaceae bacterium]